jgi:hypothetical protein
VAESAIAVAILSFQRAHCNEGDIPLKISLWFCRLRLPMALRNCVIAESFVTFVSFPVQELNKAVSPQLRTKRSEYVFFIIARFTREFSAFNTIRWQAKIDYATLALKKMLFAILVIKEGNSNIQRVKIHK